MNPSFETVLARRMGRRPLLALGAAGALLGWTRALRGEPTNAAESDLRFAPVPEDAGQRLLLPPGYRSTCVLAWGDPLLGDAPPFNPRGATVEAQARQMGYNADFVGYAPLPLGSRASAHGLLCVSSEYTISALMWPDEPRSPRQLDRDRCAVEMAAHGLNVAEVRRDVAGRWHLVARSPRNRRVSALSPLRISGPAAGSVDLRTGADATGRLVVGTLANCGGGMTPWGTWLQAEENFEDYFAADPARIDERQRASLDRLRVGRESRYGWERYDIRFDVAAEANEINRFGWLVELDPYDPYATPVKRTALGRFSHEAAGIVLDAREHVVVYTADDAEFEHLYKFVSARPFNPSERASNRDLLDAGTLYVARFDADGTGLWLPLVFGEGPLVPARGFRDQADVLVRAREAATALGATPMDRPEDVEPRPGTGFVYVALTKNTQRASDGVDAANPRGPNPHGHILELREGRGDFGATTFSWDVFHLCGREADGGAGRGEHALSCPDNLMFDAAGNLWVSTDGQPKSLGIHDALYCVATTGPKRGVPQRFLSAVPGAEVTGPCLTPDERTLFVAIQHPGEGSTFDAPSTRFPAESDSQDPPRPCVLAITREDGAPIGT